MSEDELYLLWLLCRQADTEARCGFRPVYRKAGWTEPQGWDGGRQDQIIRFT